MDRRTVLRRTAAAGASLAVAGCLRRSREENALSISDTRIETTDDGYLAYVVVVSNVANHDASGTLYVNSQLNGNASTKVRQVSLGAHSTTTVRIVYDVKYANVTKFEPSSSLREN